MKGNAPMTSTKEIIMTSEQNETEQFFTELKNHPCKYWTSSMIDKLFNDYIGYDSDNKQFKYFKAKMFNILCKKIKINGKDHRVKAFTMIDAEKDNAFIRKNIDEN